MSVNVHTMKPGGLFDSDYGPETLTEGFPIGT